MDECKKTRKIKKSVAWRIIFVTIILCKRVLSKGNLQPLNALLQIPESAFACTSTSKGEMKNLFRANMYGVV